MMNIGKRDVHLWVTQDRDIDDTQLLDSYLALLNDEEKTRYRRLRFERHRRRFLITRALVRTVLSQYVYKGKPETLAFCNNGYGKPELLQDGGTGPVYFNLSHTEGLVALGVVMNREVGVDAEDVCRRVDCLELARRYFSPREAEDLQGLESDAEKLRERFFDLWTLKESYIKACGLGLSMPLRDFSFDCSGQRIVVSFSPRSNDIPERWRFWQLQPGERHRLALAVGGKDLDGLHIITRRGVPLREFEDFHCRVLRGSQ